MEVITLQKVEDFLDTLETDTTAAVSRAIIRLENYGRNITMPHSKYIGDGLYELRIKGRQSIRIFYSFRRDGIYLLHAFIKKQDRIPIRELELAKQCLNALQRYNL